MNEKRTQHRTIDDLPELCDMADLEGILPISRSTAYRMAQRGVIPCLRIGRRFVFSREHLRTWIEENITGEVKENGEKS